MNPAIVIRRFLFTNTADPILEPPEEYKMYSLPDFSHVPLMRGAENVLSLLNIIVEFEFVLFHVPTILSPRQPENIQAINASIKIDAINFFLIMIIPNCLN